MKHSTDIQTGEVAVSGSQEILIANGIGSCIAVIAIDTVSRVSGIAHIMLPGIAPETAEFPDRYAENGIGTLMTELAELNVQHNGLKIILAGAGNVLKRPDDAICAANIQSVRQALDRLGLMVAMEFLGGTERRKIRLCPASGELFCSTGDQPESLCFRF